MGVVNSLSGLRYDRFGNLIDPSDTITERYSLAGYAWRMTFVRQASLADGVYGTISFLTPTTGRVFMQWGDISKTGYEIEYSIIEGGTYSGGTTLTPRNYNRVYPDTSPFQDCYYGVSPTATLTGGTAFSDDIIPGTSQGNVKAAAATQQSGVITLKQNTRYTYKCLVIGGATTLAYFVNAIYVANSQ